MSSTHLPSYLDESQNHSYSLGEEQNVTFADQNHRANPQKMHYQVEDSKINPSQVEPQLHKQQSQQSENEAEAQDNLQVTELTENTPVSNKYRTENSEHVQVNSKPEQQSVQNNEDEEEVQGAGYQELTMKLQTALNKIAGSKKGLNKTTSHSNTIWKRAQEVAQKKKKDLERKREESEQMKQKQVRAKPIINKNSQRLVRQVGHEPIYNRFEKILEAKQRKNKQIEQNKLKQKQEQQAMFMQELNRRMRKPQNVRTYDDYFDEMVKWKERNIKQNQEKLKLQKSKQLQGVTFKPVLNSKSKKMVSSQTRLPIDQRGLMKGQSKTQYPLKGRVSGK